nr:EpsG family protein [Paralcaligenes ureilyticus]
MDRERGKVYCALAVLVIGAIAILRGPTGTDTITYQGISAALRAGPSLAGVEPLFALLMRCLQWFLANDAMVVRAVAAVAVLLLWIYVYRADEDEQYFLLAVFMPAFSFSYTMNALRIGLASILLLLAVQQFRRSRTFGPGVGALGVAGLLCHYSLAFSLGFLVAALRPWSRKLVLGVLLSAAVLVTLIVAVSAGYLSLRLASYTNFAAPSHLSGLSSIIGVAILLCGVWRGQLPRDLRMRLLSLSIGFSILFFGTVQVSYAGVRLLDLLGFVVPLAILCAYGSSGQKLDRPVKLALCVFGLASATFMFRNFLNESPGSLAPFLPYRLIFQL